MTQSRIHGGGGTNAVVNKKKPFDFLVRMIILSYLIVQKYHVMNFCSAVREVGDSQIHTVLDL